MREVALVEARDRLDALVDQVAAGEEFTITRHGKAVARLAPITPTAPTPTTRIEPTFDRERARKIAQALLDASEGVSLGGLSIKELINEGRR